MIAEPTLDEIAELAVQAGKILLSYRGKELSKKTKGHPDNFVTDADLAAESFLISALRDRYPDHSILSEEDGWSGRSSAEFTWIIDPLDGTWNFAHGKDDFGVMIARASPLKVVQSVIYNPVKDILLVAQRENGVWLNGDSCSGTTTKTPDLSFIAGGEAAQVALSGFSIPHTCCWSTVDNTILVLQGKVSGYINQNAKIWDLAPASLMFEEFGYTIRDSTGTAYIWNIPDKGLIGAPSEILPLIFSILQGKEQTG